MGVSHASMSVQHMSLVSEEARRGHWIPGTGVTNGCELPCGCWELTPGPLEEQSVILTTEPSRQFWDILYIFEENCIY